MSGLQLPEGEKMDLDLGDDHFLQFFEDKQGHRIGAIIYHKWHTPPAKPELFTPWCAGSVVWENSETWGSHPMWAKTGDDEHLTLSPSVLCGCGDHGFIRNDKWVRA